MAQPLRLRRLEPEPWGYRMTRAREGAEFSVRQVEEVLFPHVSRSALSRLEDMREPPKDRKNRGRAALLVLLYGFELDDFELTEDDIPPAIDRRVLVGLKSGSRCYGPLDDLLAA